MVSIIIILLIAIGVKFYVDYQEDQAAAAYNQSIEEELVEKDNELARLRVDLDLKIEEIKKLGGDVADLELLKAQLEAERRKLLRDESRNKEQLQALEEKIEGYATRLREKDREIEQLRETNEQLLTENTTLKDQANRLQDTLTVIARTNEEMQAKISVAGRLRAENVRVLAINKRERERETEFRNWHIDHLKITFNIAENSVAPRKAEDIYLRVLSPSGDVLYDVATTSGTFMVNGRELFYTAKQTILFDNTRQRLSFEYQQPNDYDKGEHTVEIYCDTYLIGTSTFMVK